MIWKKERKSPVEPSVLLKKPPTDSYIWRLWSISLSFSLSLSVPHSLVLGASTWAWNVEMHRRENRVVKRKTTKMWKYSHTHMPITFPFIQVVIRNAKQQTQPQPRQQQQQQVTLKHTASDSRITNFDKQYLFCCEARANIDGKSFDQHREKAKRTRATTTGKKEFLIWVVEWGKREAEKGEKVIRRTWRFIMKMS